MMRLGRVIKSNHSIVQIHSFNIEQLKWSDDIRSIPFEIEETDFSKGNFRAAYKSHSHYNDFPKTRVLKNILIQKRTLRILVRKFLVMVVNKFKCT